MPRKAKKDEQTTIAIADLLGLASAPGRADPATLKRAKRAQQAAEATPPETRPEYSVLDDASIQRLFDTLPDDIYVGPYLAASYLRCTQLTFERHIRARIGGTDWSKRLAARKPPDYQKRRFRWSFVRDMRTHVALVARQRPSRSKKKSESDDGLLAFLEQHLFLELDGEIQMGWGQGGVTSAELRRLIKAGADLKHRTVVQALLMPWAKHSLRQPWQEAASEVIARVTRAIEREGAQASADGLVRSLPRKTKVAPGDRL